MLMPYSLGAQVVPAGTGGGGQVEPMQMPALETAAPYAIDTGSQARSNVLQGSVGFTPAYNWNLFPGLTSVPIDVMSYSIVSSITLDKKDSRLHQTYNYSPSFTFYQQVTALNMMDQSASAKLDFRWTPHLTVSGLDTFVKTSNVFNQAGALGSGSVSGSLPSSPSDVVDPFMAETSNTVNGNLGYQFHENDMVGGGGGENYMSIPSYGTPGSSSYLEGYDSTGEVGSAFYNRRLSLMRTVGVNYQYTRSIAMFSTETFNVQMHSFLPFFAYKAGKHFSANIAAGPQFYTQSVALNATSSSPASVVSESAWTPAVTASFGWQAGRSSVSASVSRTVMGGGGLVGAYIYETANLHARHQLARIWTIDVGGDYADFANSATQGMLSYPGGHSFDAEISLDRTIGAHFHATIGYQWMYVNYFGSLAQTFDPNSERAYGTISYNFSRPLGR